MRRGRRHHSGGGLPGWGRPHGLPADHRRGSEARPSRLDPASSSVSFETPKLARVGYVPHQHQTASRWSTRAPHIENGRRHHPQVSVPRCLQDGLWCSTPSHATRAPAHQRQVETRLHRDIGRANAIAVSPDGKRACLPQLHWQVARRAELSGPHGGRLTAGADTPSA